MRWTIPAALAVAVLTTTPATASSATAAGASCRGQEATHVGTPGELLVTTPGPDVVVTNGASTVRTLNGHDVICATRSAEVFVVPGGGDDIVDARGYAGDRLETSLGQRQAAGSSGDDSYFGGDQVDVVYVSAGVAADDKRIRLDGGKDELYVDRDYPGDIDAVLGRGSDKYWTERPRPGVVVDGAAGRDDLVTGCLGCGGFEAYLRPGRIAVDGDPAGRAVGFEDVLLKDVKGPVVDFALVWGTTGPNDIAVTACTAGLRGRQGADRLSVSRSDCAQIAGGLIGGRGDDILTGSRGPDTLRGGEGDDEAHGGEGDDLCRAELTTECEL